MTIDWWTLGLQTVNVVVLIWLLERFFWRPVAATIERRRATTRDVLAEAEGKRSQAVAELAEIERTRAGFLQERDEILAAARADADREAIVRLNDAATAAASLRATATAAAERDRAEADRAWTERASRLAVEIAGRLAARLEGPAVRAAFLDWLLDELRALPGGVRRGMTAAGGTLEAVSASPLEPADQERYRLLIGEALGMPDPQIAFRADPALIAGLELHGPHLIVSNSWRADLKRILGNLGHGDRA